LFSETDERERKKVLNIELKSFERRIKFPAALRSCLKVAPNNQETLKASTARRQQTVIYVKTSII
jgi:hypothetical protein